MKYVTNKTVGAAHVDDSEKPAAVVVSDVSAQTSLPIKKGCAENRFVEHPNGKEMAIERKLFLRDLNRNHTASSRSEEIAAWAWNLDAEMGPLFWNVIEQEWSRCSHLCHEELVHWFDYFRDHWEPSVEVMALPDPIEVFRGQDKTLEVGLSWTLDREVAVGYATSYLGIPNPEPVVLVATVPRNRVAFVCFDGEEDEIVLFGPPDTYGCESLAEINWSAALEPSVTSGRFESSCSLN